MSKGKFFNPTYRIHRSPKDKKGAKEAYCEMVVRDYFKATEYANLSISAEASKSLRRANEKLPNKMTLSELRNDLIVDISIRKSEILQLGKIWFPNFFQKYNFLCKGQFSPKTGHELM